MNDGDKGLKNTNKLDRAVRRTRIHGRAKRHDMSLELQKYTHILGPMPKRRLEMLVDLGLSDTEIALYHKMPNHVVTELRQIWDIAAVD